MGKLLSINHVIATSVCLKNNDYDSAATYFIKALKEDCNFESFYELAILYYNKNISHDIYLDAFRVIHSKINTHPEASFQIGHSFVYSYEHVGRSPEILQMALDYLDKSADLGYQEAITMRNDIMSDKYTADQFYTGYAFSTGNGLEMESPDPQKAKRWYKAAADNGEAMAMCNLGCMYFGGRLKDDGRTSKQSAYYWFSKAADKGNAQSMFNLGVLCETGEGLVSEVPLLPQALHWYEMARNHGYADANESIKDLKREMDEIAMTDWYNEGFRYHYNNEKDKAIECWKKAASLGKVIAFHALGIAYDEMKASTTAEMEKNLEKALFWLQLGAAMDYPPSLFALGLMYLKGRGVERNKERAMSWFKRAADKGDKLAQNNLGSLLINSNKPEDKAAALHYFMMAAKQNVAFAQYNIGLMYYKNEVPNDSNPNNEKAIQWLLLAARQGDADSIKLLTRIRKELREGTWQGIFHSMVGDIVAEVVGSEASDCIKEWIDNGLADVLDDAIRESIGELAGEVTSHYVEKGVKQIYDKTDSKSLL